jgi:putative ABC transport system permease protein
MQSLHNKIPKIILHLNAEKANYLSVRFQPENIESTLQLLKKIWFKIDPERPFDYFFIDQAFEEQYTADKLFSKLIIYFTVLAIFIACLGLLGLSSFIATQRTKEIGIRKVLGSSTQNIIILLTREFAKWILIANIIAWPLAYFLLNKWLENFEYKIPVPLFSFIAAGSLAFVIAMLTIAYQSISASLRNPVESLRYE